MSRKISIKYATILVFLSVYIPFEDYLVYLLPISSEYKVFLRQSSELILYLLLAITLLVKVTNNQLRYSPIDLLLLSFIGLAVLGILINSASWMPAINNLRALLRYVAAYYIVFNIGLSLIRWQQITRYMMFVIVIATAMSIMQYAGGGSVSQIIKTQDKIRLASDSGGEVLVLVKDEKIGAVQGMLESPGTLGIFLFTVSVLFITRYMSYSKSYDYKIRVIIIITLILSFLTYSKTAFLLNLLVIGLFFYFFIKKIRLPLAFIAIVCSLSVIIIYLYISTSVVFTSAMKDDTGPLMNIVNLFSSEYWSHFFSAERGWVISEVAPQIIKSMPLIGYSPDPDTATKLIVLNSVNMNRLLTYTAFEDVYIVAMLAYYGIIGLTLFITIHCVLIRCGFYVLVYAKTQNNQELVALCCSFIAISIGAFIYSFFERIYEVKVFSYYYWMLAGIIVRINMDIKLHRLNSLQILHANNKVH